MRRPRSTICVGNADLEPSDLPTARGRTAPCLCKSVHDQQAATGLGLLVPGLIFEKSRRNRGTRIAVLHLHANAVRVVPQAQINPRPAQTPGNRDRGPAGGHPLSAVLTSMPGVGVRTGARILTDVATSFATAAHLASYAGLAPVTRRSGGSIRGEAPARGGNKQLKRALFLAAFAALRDPASRAYYDRKISEGKRHNQALICLAHRRCDVLYSMLKNGTFYEPHSTRAA
jgi:hypothetical protein